MRGCTPARAMHLYRVGTTKHAHVLQYACVVFVLCISYNYAIMSWKGVLQPLTTYITVVLVKGICLKVHTYNVMCHYG